MPSPTYPCDYQTICLQLHISHFIQPLVPALLSGLVYIAILAQAPGLPWLLAS